MIVTLATMALAALPLCASAATLPIEGSYGNELGCRLARSGEYNPVEGVELLTPSEISTAVTLCSFDEVKPAPGNRYQVSMTCASEGSGPEDNSKDTAEISGSATGGYTVRFADGTTWGPLKKC